MAARHRVAKVLLRHGHVYREGRKAWTLAHRAWVHRQRLDDPLAQLALEQMLTHLDSVERQLSALDSRIEQIADSDRWRDQVATLTAFRGIATRTALGLIAEIGTSGASRTHASSPATSASPPANTAPATSSTADTSPSATTATPAGCSSNAPGTTATDHACPPAHCPRPIAPGKPRSACTTATDISPSTTNARPSRTSRSPASSAASCGPR
jgi:hypothetical protein